MKFSAALAELEAAFRRPLPGEPAHALMAPRPRREWPRGTGPDRIRPAAGLLLLVPRQNEAHVVLTVRAQTLERHRGQVSLPGGAVDEGESHEDAAMREAYEEVGLAPGRARVLGPLTPVDIAVSGFRLHPIVAATEEAPRLTAASGEVAAILTVPVDELLDPQRIVWRTGVFEGRGFEYPAFPSAHAEIWGATAMVLAEFLVLFGWAGPMRRPVTESR